MVTNKRNFIFLIIAIFSLSITACKSSENKDFAFLDDSNGAEATEPPTIISFTPSANPVNMILTANETFAVTVNAAAGNNVTYTYRLNTILLSSITSSFYSLSGGLLNVGLNTFEVTASNALGSDTKLFSVNLNTPPNIDSSIPAAAGNNIGCGGGSLDFTVNASDVDADGLTFTWKLNGSAGPPDFTIVTVGNSSTNTFAPSCLVSGSNTVTVDISDSYQVTTYSWAVSVNNPTVAQINAFSPLSNPVIIHSSGNQNFSISATGKNPLTYSWELNGTPIPGQTNALLNLTSAGLSIGDHVLRAIATDPDSNDSHDFNVKRNAPPVISNPSPVDLVIKNNYETLRTFSVDVADANGDALTYTWTLNGLASIYLADSVTGSGTQAIFSPDASLLGANTIQVVADDGTETAVKSWTVNVNYFTTDCNALDPGEICTLIGGAGIGSGLIPGTDDERIKVYPTDVLDDGNGNLFIADQRSHVVWFYNRSLADVTVLSRLVPAGQIVAVVGNGASGYGVDGASNNNYQLLNPYSIAWDSVNGRLFIANYSRHRIVTVDPDGSAHHYICSGGTANNAAAHPEGGAAAAVTCRYPVGVAYDSVNERLFVSAYDQHYIKYFDVSDPNPVNWTGYMLVGRSNGSGVVSGGSEDGPIGPGLTAARTNRPWAISIGSNGLIYFSEYQGCRVRVANIDSGTQNFFGGAVTVNDNEVVSLSGTYNSCTATTGAYNTARQHRPRGMEVYEDGIGNVLGWFVSHYTQDRITFLNNTGVTVTVGGRAVAAYSQNYIWGSGINGYSGESGSAMNSLLNVPYDMDINNTNDTLIIADTNNQRIRSLDISIADGAMQSYIGGGFKFGDAVGPTVDANDVDTNYLAQITYDPSTNSMLFSDSTNGSIRRLDLTTGQTLAYIGIGPGNSVIEQENPLDVVMRYVRGITIFNNDVVFGLRYAGGVNRDCLVRVYNRGALNTSFWNTTVNAGKVASVAGNYAIGCNNWNVAHDGGQARSAGLHYVESIATDGTNLYMAIYQTHCILKVDASGVITEHIGLCNTQGNVEVNPATSNANRMRYPVDIVTDPRFPTSGNLFIADQSNQNAGGRIKYLNMTASPISIAGVTVPANSLQTLFNVPYPYGIAAFDNQVCYTSGYIGHGGVGGHNVTCKDRDSAIGATTMRAGQPDAATVHAGSPMANEEEGVLASSANLFIPYGLEFDGDGNLYITENGSFVIRMVRRWW